MTDNQRLAAFFQFGAAGQLDGSVAWTSQSKKLYFTRVEEKTIQSLIFEGSDWESE